MRRRWVLVVLIVIPAASLGGYALARPSPTSKASSNGWTAYAPVSTTSHTSTQPRSYPITSLPPGKLILARLRLRSGARYFIYGQRIRFQGRRYFCLSAGNLTGSFQTCPPWPLAPGPTRLLIGGGASPTELAVAIAPRNDTCTFVGIPGGPYRASRVRVSSALKINGDLVYAFVKRTSGNGVIRSTTSATSEQFVIGSPGKARCRPTASLSDRLQTRDVLHGNGIVGVRFGEPPDAVIRALELLLGQPSSGYVRGGSCGLDHKINWSNRNARSERSRRAPVLTVYFKRSQFAGYQYGEYGTLLPPSSPRHGITLATTSGLGVGDKLTRGQRLYGKAFAISGAQGGSWRVTTASGAISGYAWGTPKHGDVSPQSVVATIDAGDVGCAALSP